MIRAKEKVRWTQSTQSQTLIECIVDYNKGKLRTLGTSHMLAASKFSLAKQMKVDDSTIHTFPFTRSYHSKHLVLGIRPHL